MALLPVVTSIVSMVAGTLFCVWLGELITEYGIGNGISIIIFGGYRRRILAGGTQAGTVTNIIGLIVYVAIIFFTIWFIVVFTEAHRRIPVHMPVCFPGVGCTGRAVRHISPIRINSAGIFH